MPDMKIVDAHLHIWDPARIALSWQAGNALMARPYHVEDYARDTQGLDIEAMVFIEAFVDPGHFAAEVAFVEEEARRDPRIRAIIAQASVEQGRRVLDFLGPLKDHHGLLRGVRRLIEFDPDPEICLRPSFIEGVRALEELGLSFEINVHHTQMAAALDFARQVEHVPLILDHCGKPGIRDQLFEPWARHIAALARLPNVHCKLSGLTVEADRERWTVQDLAPYVEFVVGAFGFDRLIFGGDWPVCLAATTMKRWVDALDLILKGSTRAELERLYRDNALAFYRLGP